jgi:hypothetical protein
LEKNNSYAVRKLKEERRGFNEACTALIEAKQAAKSCFYEAERELNALKANYDKLWKRRKTVSWKEHKQCKAAMKRLERVS